MEDEKNETEDLKEEVKSEVSEENPEAQEFVHQDSQQEGNFEQMTPVEGAAKKKRSKWVVVGIILLIVIGIPLILFGTCMLLFAR